MSDGLIEKMAEALWETWRMSDAAKPEYRDLPWSDLVAMAGRYGPDNVAARLVALGIAETRASLAILAKPENISDSMVLDASKHSFGLLHRDDQRVGLLRKAIAASIQSLLTTD